MAEAEEEEQPPNPLSSTMKSEGPKDLEAALALLEKKDDTSRFVGLALLKPLFEQRLGDCNTEDGDERATLIEQCWGAIPVKFLSRLLNARANGKNSKGEANDMLGLAVAVIRAFAGLLASPHTDEKFMSQVWQIP